jgi:hypothetical protein
MKTDRIKAAQKQVDRALANLDRVANYLEDAGLSEQVHMLDGAPGNLGGWCGKFSRRFAV